MLVLDTAVPPAVHSVPDRPIRTGDPMPSTARTYRIATIPGDGVGREVVDAGRVVLDWAADW